MVQTTDNRKEEIISACENLYEKFSFKDISIKLISEKTTFSRPSIYNYFDTKEEIFLCILTRDYNKWVDDLKNILKNNSLSKEDFSKELAHSLEKRERLLKLMSINMYDMEENSKIDYVVNLKKAYGESLVVVRECLVKFFPDMTDSDVESFVYSFFPFMIGIYPYAVVNDKRKEAMEVAKVQFKYHSLYEIAETGIKKILGVK